MVSEIGRGWRCPSSEQRPLGGHCRKGPGSADGQAALFIIYLDGGQNGQWTEGQDYIRINTGAGTSNNSDALSSPTVVDLGGNGTADRAHAGDSDGNVWAFDLSGSNALQWGVAYRRAQTPEPLFAGSSSHPITAAPAVFSNTVAQASPGSADPDVMVFVGSGAYYRNSDKTDTTAQRF